MPHQHTQQHSVAITTAMILAAGRGQRMQPLSNTTPKPLLPAGDHRLIEWQIMRLVKAGIKHIVINCAWLSEQFKPTLGDGSRYGCELVYSIEGQALETAGGIAFALPLLLKDPYPVLVVSGDIYTEFDYAGFTYNQPLIDALNAQDSIAHLVVVDNPEYHRAGDMYLDDTQTIKPVDQAMNDQGLNRTTYTYANMGLFNVNIFRALYQSPTIQATKLFPWLYEQGRVTGQHYQGVWHNVGTPTQLEALDTFLKTSP